MKKSLTFFGLLSVITTAIIVFSSFKSNDNICSSLNNFPKGCTLTQNLYSDNRSTHYTYDDNNLLASIKSGKFLQFTYQRDELGRVTQANFMDLDTKTNTYTARSFTTYTYKDDLTLPDHSDMFNIKQNGETMLTTSTEYEIAGNKIISKKDRSYIDGEKNITTYEYKDDENTWISRRYDEAGTLVARLIVIYNPELLNPYTGTYEYTSLLDYYAPIKVEEYNRRGELDNNRSYLINYNIEK